MVFSFATVSTAPGAITTDFNANPNGATLVQGIADPVIPSASSGFDLILTLTNPYLYNPAAGNLLLEIADPNDAAGPDVAYTTADPNAGGLVDATQGGVHARAGLADTIQFTFQPALASVPEIDPSTSALPVAIVMGLLGIATSRRKVPACPQGKS